MAGHAPAAAPAPVVEVTDPKTMSGPPTEYPPVHADVPREQWAWGRAVPENPEMWPASAAPSAPSSEPQTQVKRPPMSEPDPRTMPRADLPKEQWAWGDVIPDNPGMLPESVLAPSSGSAPTLDKPTLVKPGQPPPGADAPPTVRKAAPAQPEAPLTVKKGAPTPAIEANAPPTVKKDRAPAAEPNGAPEPKGGLAPEGTYFDKLAAGSPQQTDDRQAAEMLGAARAAGHEATVSPDGDRLQIGGKTWDVTTGPDPDAVPGRPVENPAPAPQPGPTGNGPGPVQAQTPIDRARAASTLYLLTEAYGEKPILTADEGLRLYEYGSALGDAQIETHGPTAIVTVGGKRFLVRNTDDFVSEGVDPAMPGEPTGKVNR